jgi:pimeloyl-ACP methyl ester carboxylesterase
MTSIPTLDGIAAGHVSTDRITTRILFSGPTDGIPVLFLHGNHSSATWWEDNMLNLPVGYRAIAPDMRGFGEADPSLKIDATRGCADWGEDVLSLMDHLGYETFHLVGSSLGGNVGWWLVVNAGSRLRSFIGVCPGSPIGFGGTKGRFRRRGCRSAPATVRGGDSQRRRHRRHTLLAPGGLPGAHMGDTA